MTQKPSDFKLQFLGATGTVTGSRYLLTYNHKKIMIDCGLFQGLKQLRLRNWNPFPIDPKEIDAILLTHAHIDHSGYLPRVVKMGFKGPVYATRGTKSLCAILLPDAAYLQEEDAKYLNSHGLSKHKPALPLYSVFEANQSLKQINAVEWNTATHVCGLEVRFIPVSHLLGASCIHIKVADKTILFSGDVGRSQDPILPERAPVPKTNYLVVESTYGDREHPKPDNNQELTDIINQTVKRKGIVLIPTFAIGRAQSLIYIIHQLKKAGRIPNVPLYLNSPMATEATKMHLAHASDLKMSLEELKEAFSDVNYIHTPKQSMELNHRQGPAIILSSSGMITGGRILHHMKTMAPDPKNSIVIVGFQAAGTRGEALVRGKKQIKIHGEIVPINAQVHCLQNMSGHADHKGIMQWLRDNKISPYKTFITHGEPLASEEMRLHLKDEFGWECIVPEHLQEFNL